MATSPAPARFQTYKAQVKLAPGQTLAYQPGRGYYAKTRGASYDPRTPPAPAPPLVSENGLGGGNGPQGTNYRPLPPTAPGKTGAHPPAPPTDPYAALQAAEIARRAGAMAQGEIDPQKAAINEAAAKAQAQAKADEDALAAFGLAGSKLEGDLAPGLAGAYHQATVDQGQLGQGIAGQVGADLQAAHAGQDDFARLTGEAGAAAGPNAQDAQNTLGMLQSVIPGDLLTEQGLANVSQAYRAPQINLAATREQIHARMAEATKEGDTYAQKLLDLAATYPDLKAKALDQLNQYELDKANYREKVATDKADAARQDRALTDQEKAAGFDIAKANAEYKYKYAALAFKNAADAKKAAQSGKIIDVSASKLLGHVVYKDGSENPAIKVAKSTTANTAQGKAQANRYKDTRIAQAKAQTVANGLYAKGKFVTAPKQADIYGGTPHGKFQADPRWPRAKMGPDGKLHGPPGAVNPDGTTTNPKRALKTGLIPYPQAAQNVYNAIGGAALEARYGYSHEQIMAWVNSALAAAGFHK